MSKTTPRRPEGKAGRGNDAAGRIQALRRQLQALQQDHASGSIDAQALAAAKEPLERQLLDLVMADPAAATAAAAGTTAAPGASTAAAPRPSRALVAGLLAGVLVLAVAGYSYTGSPGATVVADGAAPGAAGGEPLADEQQFAEAVEKLAQRLKDQPDNAEGWAMLARSYARLGRQAEAVSAFAKAVALQGDDPRLLADFADTLAVANNRSLDGEPTQLVERALKIDPRHPKALALAGTAAYDKRDFKSAVRYWETLATVLPPDSDFMPQLQASIDQAREQAGMPKGQPPTAPGASTAPAAPGAAPQAQAAPASTAKLQGTVRLAASVAAQAAPTDTVFIVARAADGPRMPLAILRHQVKDLPLNFTLDDSTAMSPAMRLSLFPQVVVTARVSKSGQAMPAPGDLTGQSAAVANTASGVTIEISEVVRN